MKTIQIKVLLIPILVILLNFKDSFSQSNDIRVLDIEYINQVHGCCWCWAACITSIANYYGNDNIQLCDIVDFRRINSNLGTNDCCGIVAPYSAHDTTTCILGCAFGWSTDPIRTIFQDDLNINCTYIAGVLSYSAIKQEIDNNRPIKIIVGNTNQWGNPSYHSIIIYGYDDDGEMIHYIDPGSGYWEESYYNMTNTYCIGTLDRMYGYGASCSYRISSDPCPTNLNLTVNIGSDAVITASNSIQCSSTINNNAEVEFISGNILLNNGFAVEIGASLAIEISSNPCQ